MKKRALLAVVPLLTFMGCSRPAPQQIIVYPEVKTDSSERKAGQAMLFYEAAEKDADVNNVEVTPPPAKKK